MNKIFRMAIVCTLAGAALLYTGCTKDYSGDVKEISSEVTALQTKVNDVNNALEKYKTEANAAIQANATAIAAKADASTVQALKTEVENLKPIVNANATAITGLQSSVNSNASAIADLLSDVSTAQSDIEALKNAQTAFNGTAEDLLDFVSALAARITNIVPVPSKDTTLSSIGIQGSSSDTVTVFSAKFAVRPAEAASQITKDNAKILIAEGTKAVANKIPTTLDITTLNYKEDGIIEVFASKKGNSVSGAADANYAVYYAIDFTAKDDADSTYDVISDYAKATVANNVTSINDLYFRYKGDTKLTAAVTDSIAVPYDAADSKWAPLADYSIKMVIGGNALTPADGAALLGIAETLTAVGDTSAVSVATIPAAAVKYTKADQSFAIVDVLTAKANIYANTGNEDVNVNNGFLAKDSSALANVVPITYKYRVAKSVKEVGTFAAQTVKWNYTGVYTFTTQPGDIDVTANKLFPEGPAVNGKTKADSAVTAVFDYDDLGHAQATITFNNFPTTAPGDQTTKLEYINTSDTLRLTVPFTVTEFPGKTAVDLGDSTYVISDVLNTNKTFTFNPQVKYAAIPKADTTAYFGDLTGTSAALYAAFDAVPFVYDTTIVTKADGSATTIALTSTDVVLNTTTGDVAFANGVLGFGQNYKVKFTKKVFGQTYKFEFDVIVPEATFAFAKTENVNANNEVTVEGDTTATPGVYTIARAFIKNYLTVRDKESGELSAVANLQVKTNLTFEDSTLFDNGTDTVLNSETVTIATDPANVTAGLIDAATNINWANYEGRKIFAHVALKAGAQTVDSIDLTLIAQKPVTATFGDIALDRPVGADTTFSIAKNLKVYGVLKPNVNIIDPTTGLQTGTIDYKVVVTPDWTKVEGSIDGGARRPLNSTEYAGAGMNLTIKGDSHNPTMVVYVPVTIEYYLDYNKVDVIKGEVKVVATGTAS